MVKKCYKVYKKDNEYLALMTAYGLAKILNDNEFDFVIRNKKAWFEVEADVELPYEDWIFHGVSEDDIQYLGDKILSKSERENRYHDLNQFFEEPNHLNLTFRYYETGDESYIKHLDTKSTLIINSIYYSKGRRGSNKPSGAKISTVESMLSLYGYANAVSFYKTKDFETISVFVPRETKVFRKPYEFYSRRDKETGEVKRITYFGKDAKIQRTAILYLEAIKSLQRESIVKDFESIFIASFLRTSQKPTPDKSYHIPVHSLSIDTCDELLKKLTYSNVPEDIKMLLSQFIVFQSSDLFGKLMRLMAKKNEIMYAFVLKEWISLQSEQLQRIYQHEIVKKAGKRLARLQSMNKGHQAKVCLVGCSTFKDLSKGLSLLSMEYRKIFASPFKMDEVEELMTLAKDANDVRIIADAILMYGSIWFDKE